MVNKAYQKGYRFERKVKLWLESLGYAVMGSKGSKFPDGFAASTVSYIFKRFYFECKDYKDGTGNLSKEEIRRAKERKKQTGIQFVVFYNVEGKIKWWIV